jgi:hypothetical protein
MPGTLTPTCAFCGLRFGSRPLLELHIREDHLQRDHSAVPRKDDSGTRPAPHNQRAASRPRRPRTGWAVAAARRTAAAFRRAIHGTGAARIHP